MNQVPLYPMRFDPILQYRPWGGRRLANLISGSLPGDSPIGEAWLLSDRDDHPNLVANGPLKGHTIAQLTKDPPEALLGKLAGRFDRFPLLLKFLNVNDALSVQMHPADSQTQYIPAGEHGKTEAWGVLEVGPKRRVFAGFKAGNTPEELAQAISDGTVADCLASFTPKRGDAVLVEAGAVHSLRDVVVCEVQGNSDITFRLYDWNHVDPKTSKLRPLQVKQAMACVDFARGPVGLVAPVNETLVAAQRELLLSDEHFGLWRHQEMSPFMVGAEDVPRVPVCIAGGCQVEHAGIGTPFATGDVMLVPAAVGACLCRPLGPVTLLEVSLPEGT